MRLTTALFCLTLASGGLSACCDPCHKQHPLERHDGIVRIFMDNAENKWSILVKGGRGQLVMTTFGVIQWSNDEADVVFYPDVPPDRDMWVVGRRYDTCNEGPTIYQNLEFHVHSFQDVSGGASDDGRFGGGRVSPVE